MRVLAKMLVIVQDHPWYITLVRQFPRAEVRITFRPERAGYRFSAFQGNREIAQAVLQHLRERAYPGWWIFALRVGIFSRRLGIGRRLMCALIDFARANDIPVLYLHVYADNAHLIPFYENMGFRVIPSAEGYNEHSGRRFISMQCVISEGEAKRAPSGG